MKLHFWLFFNQLPPVWNFYFRLSPVWAKSLPPTALIENNLFQYKLHTAWIIINNRLYKIDHHSKNHTSSLDQKICDGKKKYPLVPGAVCVALPLLASHSRSLRHHCSTPFLFIRSNYNHAVPILVRRGSTILFMTAGLSVQLLARAPPPSL